MVLAEANGASRGGEVINERPLPTSDTSGSSADQTFLALLWTRDSGTFSPESCGTQTRHHAAIY